MKEYLLNRSCLVYIYFENQKEAIDVTFHQLGEKIDRIVLAKSIPGSIRNNDNDI